MLGFHTATDDDEDYYDDDDDVISYTDAYAQCLITHIHTLTDLYTHPPRKVQFNTDKTYSMEARMQTSNKYSADQKIH